VTKKCLIVWFLLTRVALFTYVENTKMFLFYKLHWWIGHDKTRDIY